MKKIKNQLRTSIKIMTFVILGSYTTVYAQSIAGGTNHSLKVCSNGTLDAWGLGTNGQLGNGTNVTYNNAPVQVSTLTGITDVQAGTHFSLALKNDGTVWAWGKNTDGQLGNGNNSESNLPVQVSVLTNVVAIAAGFYHSLAIKSDGTVWTWGQNNNGQLGNGTLISSNVPIQISGVSTAIAIAVGDGQSLILKSDGTIWALGRNFSGQLGNGTTNNSQVLVQVSNLTGVIAIAGGGEYSMGLKSDGTVWTWGNNNYGQLGNGVTGPAVNLPVQVSGLSGVTAIEAGWYQSVALKSDGTVRAWGRNDYGQLGNGSLTNSNLPVQVSALTGVTAIATGWSHCIALKNDGTTKAWGRNDYGQLGNGNYTNSLVYTQVTGLCGSPVGIQENSIESSISVDPNPSNGIFQLNFDNVQSETGAVEIYNAFGEKVYSNAKIEENIQIDLSALSKGIYYLKVNSDVKNYYQKIVVQ